MGVNRFRVTGTLFLALTLGFIGLSGAHSRAASGEGATGRGFDVASLDRSCKPCDDFNQFANGGWMKANPIPAAYADWGRFRILNESNQKNLHKILESAKDNTSTAKDSPERKIGDYYCSCMDSQRIEAEGIKPIEPDIDRIKNIKDRNQLIAEVARLHTNGVRAFFAFSPTQDYKNSTEVTGDIEQGGLGLPDRDYYTKEDERSKNIRTEYLAHMTKMFELVGLDAQGAAAHAKVVMDVETRLAQASMTRVEQRDPNATYHRMSLTELTKLTPDIPWQTYFQGIGWKVNSDINVEQPKFFQTVNNMLTNEPLTSLQIYLAWHILRTNAPRLSSKFVDENFHFYGTVLTGAKENLDRWKRCVAATDGALGDALGQVYVKQYFPPEAKAKALEMVKNLQAALRADLQTLSWMSADTRKEALKKLDSIVNKIGYPDKWIDYTALKVERNDYVANVQRAAQFRFAEGVDRIGKPVDRTRWGMTPPTVNAYYNPQLNEIAFPAGILQPPFFDPNADDAINYGGIGAVIGHELTHGFDDSGRQFDFEGNLKNWWTDQDLKNFQTRATCVEEQFNGFEAEPGLHLNGKLVLGESIADLGGLTIAYAALQRSMEGKPRPKEIDGFTPEQRFFLGWAQVWAQNARPEFMRLQTNTNPHPLARFRINGPLSNLPDFLKAFSCQKDDRMTRANSCLIW